MKIYNTYRFERIGENGKTLLELENWRTGTGELENWRTGTGELENWNWRTGFHRTGTLFLIV